ncbi:hypothetical protein M9Y10_010372 [Tritrichomonas musculus]|uniref:Uncharacterized protein n=1 Tax=Tritrichomonas musculus TaxID=1915356 RepID=A0ABR2ILS2_9EUKA
MSKKKPQITFETENDLHDSIKTIFKNINEGATEFPQMQPYLLAISPISKFVDDCYGKNVKLLEILQEMNSQIVVIASKIQMIHGSIDTDKDNLKKLKDEFDEASKMVLFTNKSEKKSKELLVSLRTTIQDLSEKILNSETFTMGEGTSVFELKSDVTNLTNERNKANSEIREMKNKIFDTKASNEALKEQTASLTAQMERLSKSLSDKSKQSESIKTEVDEVTSSLAELKPQIQHMQQEVQSKAKAKAEKAILVEQLKQTRYKTLSGLGAVVEEAKKRKEKRNHKNRQITELQKMIHNRTVRIESDKERLKSCEDELTYLHKKLTEIQKQSDEYQSQYDQMTIKSNELIEVKLNTRKKVKELRSKVVPLQFQYAQVDNLLSLDQRSIISAQFALTKEQNLEGEEKRATNEVKVSIKTIKTDTKGEKSKLEKMKESFMYYLEDIENTRSEKVKFSNLADMASEKNKLIIEENEVQLKELQILQVKSEHQSALSEQLRDERNTSKRRLEEIEIENNELRTLFNELETSHGSLHQKYQDMLLETAKDHLSLRALQEDIGLINMKMDNMQKMIKTTERITSRIQAESQTLFHILQDAGHDGLQQQKELQLLIKNKEVVQTQILKKDTQLNELKEKIKADQLYLKKCSKMFKDTIQSMIKMQTELENCQQLTKELEIKREKSRVFEYEMHKMLTDSIVEKEKFAALTHEFAVPRNVHRWDLLNAVDPGLVKQLKFRTEISGKIDLAHRKHLELLKEKEDLEGQLQKMREKMERTPSKAQVQNDIQRYKEDIKRMDDEMSEIDAKLITNRKQISDKFTSISTVRNKVAERKEITIDLTNDISELRASSSLSSNDGYAWFMTEIPVSKPSLRGGGFSLNPAATTSTYSERSDFYRKERKTMNNLNMSANTMRTGGLFVGPSPTGTAAYKRSSVSAISYSAKHGVSPIYYVQPKTSSKQYSGYGWTRTVPSMT